MQGWRPDPQMREQMGLLRSETHGRTVGPGEQRPAKTRLSCVDLLVFSKAHSGATRGKAVLQTSYIQVVTASPGFPITAGAVHGQGVPGPQRVVQPGHGFTRRLPDPTAMGLCPHHRSG